MRLHFRAWVCRANAPGAYSGGSPTQIRKSFLKTVGEGLKVNRPKAERSHPGVCPRRLLVFRLLCRMREGELPHRDKRSWPGTRSRCAASVVFCKGFALRGEFLSQRWERNQWPRPPSLAPSGQFTLRTAYPQTPILRGLSLGTGRIVPARKI